MASEGQQAEYVALAGNSVIARCAMYPRINAAGEFSWKFLLDPVKYNQKKAVSPYGISVCSPAHLETGDTVHGYGCRLSHTQNETQRAREDAAGKPAGAKRHYIGSYYSRVDWILDAASADCSLAVIVKPENGEQAHCEIVLSPPEGVEKGRYAEARADALIEIANGLVGPDRHVCECDIEDEHWISKLPLIDNGFDLDQLHKVE